MMNPFVVTATRSMRKYTARVIEHLVKFPSFSPISEIINGMDLLQTDSFADGEIEVAVTRSVRGMDVILFSSSARNEANLTVEEAKIELYHAIDALKRSQARNIIIFEPFISSSRSDRTTRRNSVGLWIHFKTLASLGARHILTYQLHSKISQSMLDPSICTLDDIHAQTLLEKYLCDHYIRDLEYLRNTVRPNWAFCSVDAGGEHQIRDFADAFGSSLVIAHKQRDYSRVNSVKSVSILSAEPVEGKILWIYDDLVDTASSVETLIRALAPLKPAEVNIIAVHAVFSPPAAQRLNRLQAEGLLKRVIVTDSVWPSPEPISSLEVVSSTELSAQLIHTFITNQSMSKILEVFNAEKYLKTASLFS
ncbi:MAG: ribose-phosphate diphosphokinase [Treponema sp.]|nr:ribose-phosphate diphosphokinase [Treponema sp.]